jgi:N-acylglucosamine-6-phosphate 2-epimerase
MFNPLEILKNALIVAVHPEPGEPLYGMDITVAMARAVIEGGAKAIRTGGCAEIKAISGSLDIPIIGFTKLHRPDYSEVRVTASFEDAKNIVEAGADMISMEATGRPRQDGLSDMEMIQKIKQELHVPVMADISTIDEGIAAAKAGADFVATSLAGYTPQSIRTDGYDFELLNALIKQIPVPVIAEGHISTPTEARQALSYGAFAVVVGTAITRPHLITKKFVSEIDKALK